MTISRDSSKKKWSAWQGRFRKDTVITGLNILLQKQLGDDYEKSSRRDEQHIVSSDRFKNAVQNARKKLNFSNSEPIAKHSKMNWINTQLDQDVSAFDNHPIDTTPYERFKAVVDEALENAGLPSEWYSYMSDYIVDNSPPNTTLFIHPKKIWVEDINEDNELLIRLKPGLRYEDYRKAWKALSRPLGQGIRLNKPYTGEDAHLEMLKDKQSGLTYKEVTTKHYPNTDPLNNIDRVKKAIQRAKRRQERDI